MKIVVIGGTGRVGSKLVELLRGHGHDALAAAPNTGVDTITGEGLAAALDGASVVVDVSNSPSFEDAAVLEFFTTSTRNLLAAEAAAGVGHHVAMSIVGSDRLPDSGYLRAKVAQEHLIEASSVPYSIVRATQFFEFIESIAGAATAGDTVHVSSMLFQPMAVDDVAAAVCEVALGVPVGGIMEIAGPEVFPHGRAGAPSARRAQRPTCRRRRSAHARTSAPSSTSAASWPTRAPTSAPPATRTG